MNEILEDLKRLVAEIDDLDDVEKNDTKSKNPFMNIQIDNSKKRNRE